MTNAFELDPNSDDPFTTKVNIAEAKARLSELVERALTPGHTVVICRSGKPLVELKPVAPRPKRKLGFMPGPPVPDEFFDVLSPEEIAWWEGEHDDPELAP
jgi:prevent-host-death family protein